MPSPAPSPALIPEALGSDASVKLGWTELSPIQVCERDGHDPTIGLRHDVARLALVADCQRCGAVLMLDQSRSQSADEGAITEAPPMTEQVATQRTEEPVERDKTGVTWRSTLPCPDCGRTTIIAYLLVNERGEAMHTRYVCTFWPSGLDNDGVYRHTRARCGWEGWIVPGWDTDLAELTGGDDV